MEGEVSVSDVGLEADRTVTHFQTENDKETACETVVESQEDQNASHVSACLALKSVHEMPSGQLSVDTTETSSVLSSKPMSASSEKKCRIDGDTPQSHSIDKQQFSFSSPKAVSGEHDECLETGMFRMSLQAESTVHESSDFKGQMKLTGENSVDSPVDETAPVETEQGSDEGQTCSHRGHPEQENGTSEGQVHDEQLTENESRTGTGYLDGVISSIQSLTCSQQDADKDTVQISRAELTLMVEQTLAAQTMCNYMQDLVEKNRTLNKQNKVLKDKIVQARKGEREDEEGERLKSLPAVSAGAKAQVFQFPGSLPPMHIRLSSSHSHQLQTDGDLTSTSLQLPSQISLDGDTSLNREVSASGKTSHHLSAMNGAASGASVPSHGASTQNMPHDSVFAEARCNFPGPQQCHESVAGSAGVSLEQFQRVLDELEKTKLFVNRIIGAGNIHPDVTQELVNLREKVQNLQEENSKMKIELQNKPGSIPVGSVPVLKTTIADLEGKIRTQKKREDELLQLLAKVGTVNSVPKQGAGTRLHSQPSSSLGLQALPPIPPTATVDCQTEEPYVNVENLIGQNQTFQVQLVNLNDQLMQARKKEEEWMNTVKTLRSSRAAKDEEISQLRRSVSMFNQKIQELLRHRDELAQQMIHFNNANEEQKKKLSQEMARITELEKLPHEVERYKKQLSQERVRNKELEKMIDDERRRYARDERELLDRVKMLTEMNREVNLLKQVILANDRASTEGGPLPQDLVSRLTALRRQEDPANPSVRRAGSQGAVSGPASSSRHLQSHNAPGSVCAGPAAAGSQRTGGSHGPPAGHSSGKGTPASSNSSPQVVPVPYVSLPLPQVRNTDHQYCGQAGQHGSQ